MPVSTDDLRTLEALFRTAYADAEQARRKRNAAVHAALKEGWSHGKIAKATRQDPDDSKSGLSRGRIDQIKKLSNDPR